MTTTFKCSERNRKILGQVAAMAEEGGYGFVNPATIISELNKTSRDSLLRKLQKMPQEKYANPNQIRARLVTFGYVDPNGERILFDSPTEDPKTGEIYFSYNLKPTTNRDVKPAEDRRYTAMPSQVLKNAAFRKLVHLGYLMSPVLQRDATLQRFQAHLIRFTPKPDVPSVATPDTFHQDDDFAFCVFLLERKNIRGGVNYFAAPQHVNKRLEALSTGDILMSKELEKPFSAYSVNDRRVCHYVSSMEYVKQKAVRTILILAFAPMDVREVSVKEQQICDLVEMPQKRSLAGLIGTMEELRTLKETKYREMWVETARELGDAVGLLAW